VRFWWVESEIFTTWKQHRGHNFPTGQLYASRCGSRRRGGRSLQGQEGL